MTPLERSMTAPKCSADGQSDVARLPFLAAAAAAHAPVLRDAFRRIATVRIRNQATVGGNLCHADPAQDPPPVLIALGASVHLAGPAGRRRTVPIESFFTDYFTTEVGADEAMVGVTVPPQPAGSTSVYLRFLPRTTDDYPTVSVATSVRTDSCSARSFSSSRRA